MSFLRVLSGLVLTTCVFATEDGMDLLQASSSLDCENIAGCTRIYDPVCGIVFGNGFGGGNVTYPNRCVAECQNGAAILCERECPCTGGPVCEQPPFFEGGENGLVCFAAIPRWSFNQDSGECEMFIYGGCNGNDNNFATKSECEASCVSIPKCQQPPFFQGDGPYVCLAYIPSWSFNQVTGQCEHWIYGGCGANDNIFSTEAKCESECE